VLRSEQEKKIEAMRPDGEEIHKIIRNNDLELLEFCLFGDSDPLRSKPRSAINLKDRRGMTPLHLAVSLGLLPIVQFLVRSGCHLNSRDKDQSTALHTAASRGYIEIGQYLISSGISTDAKDKSQLTYVGVAAREGNLLFLQKAITDWGADALLIKELDLTGRQMKDLPQKFPWNKLENLRVLDLSGNNLDLIPEEFIHLPWLEKVVRIIIIKSYYFIS